LVVYIIYINDTRSSKYQNELHYFELVVFVVVLYSYMMACKLVNSDVSENYAVSNFMVELYVVQED